MRLKQPPPPRPLCYLLSAAVDRRRAPHCLPPSVAVSGDSQGSGGASSCGGILSRAAAKRRLFSRSRSSRPWSRSSPNRRGASASCRIHCPGRGRRQLPPSKTADSVEEDAGLATFFAGPFTPQRSRSFTSYPQDMGAYPQPNTGCGGRIRPCPGAANMRSERDPKRGGHGDRSSWGTTIRTPCSPERSRRAARCEQGCCKDAG
jgi:hypothetical protein